MRSRYRGSRASSSLRSIAQRRERSDEVARGLAGVAVFRHQRRERGLGAGAWLEREMRLVARQIDHEIRDALRDRLAMLLEVRVFELAHHVREDLGHHRLLAFVIERPRADLRDQALPKVVRAAGDLERALDL